MNTQAKITVVCFAATVALAPSTASASCEAPGASQLAANGLRSDINGARANIGSDIRNTENRLLEEMRQDQQDLNRQINAMQDAVVDKLSEVGVGLQGSLDVNREANTSAIDAQTKTLLNALRQQTTAQGIIAANKEFGYGKAFTGPDGRTYRTTSQPMDTCTRAGAAGTSALGSAVSSRRRQQAEETVKTHRTAYTGPKAKAARLKTLVTNMPDSFEARALPGETRVLEEDDIEATRQHIINVTDPEPPEALNNRLAGTPEGVEYETKRQLYYAELDPYQKILTRIAAKAYPIMPGASHQQMVASLTPEPELLDQAGNISEGNAMRAEVLGRYANKQWMETTLPQLTAAGLVREQMQMQAIQMKMQHEQMVTLHEIAWMLAQQGADGVRDDNLQNLDATYKRAAQ